jgi:hypothetical protein
MMVFLRKYQNGYLDVFFERKEDALLEVLIKEVLCDMKHMVIIQ